MRGPLPGSVVLQTAIDVIGRLFIRLNVVELRYRQRIEVRPGDPLIEAHVNAAVSAEVQVIGGIGIDPECVVIGVYPSACIGGLAERVATVVTDRQRERRAVHPFGIFGVNHQRAEIERAGRHIWVGTLIFPRFSGVGGDQETCFFAFDDSEHIIGCSRSERERDTSESAFGQTVGNLSPVFAAVGTLVERTAGSP